ncbi:MAG TPA: FxLYD domain-containing protein [Verrucomicrobiae bacterium]|jgi:hypothetical protein|nr:FxLYD domain-containing protein [Verrucomicrobiae bacterium]
MAETKYLKCACQKCGGHIEFPVEAVGTAADCPHCGQRTDLVLETEPTPDFAARWRRWLLVVVGICCLGVIVLEAGLYYFKHKVIAISTAPAKSTNAETAGNPVSSPPTDTQAVAEAVPKPPKALGDLKVGEIQLQKTKDSSLVYAVGTLKNESDYQRFGVKIELQLLDAHDLKVGTAQDYLQVLEPRRDWEFHALIISPKAVKATVASIKEED